MKTQGYSCLVCSCDVLKVSAVGVGVSQPVSFGPHRNGFEKHQPQIRKIEFAFAPALYCFNYEIEVSLAQLGLHCFHLTFLDFGFDITFVHPYNVLKPKERRHCTLAWITDA